MQMFLWGALSMGCITAGLIFLKFWTQTRDRLFAIFGAAFMVLSLNWAVLALTFASNESRHYAFFIRLAAFVLILAGIIDKNRSGRDSK